MLEKRSIYTDLRLQVKIPFYRRFYDDGGALTNNARSAQLLCRRIEEEDEDHHIRLTVDYPETGQYTPFLNTEVKIEPDGSINTRLYRKPQKKLLTLNYNSHHPLGVKTATVANLYATAESVSSSEANTDYSVNIIDQLLLNNGYDERVLTKMKEKHSTNKSKKKSKKKNKQNDHVRTSCLKLPFLSDTCTAKIKRAAEQCFLPLKIVTTPGKRLKDMLTSSRPLDRTECPRGDSCRTCEALRAATGKDDVNCTMSNVIYEIYCKMLNCPDFYDGETGRPLHDRFNEHYLTANNPTAASYENKPLAKHYREKHPDCSKPELSVKILEKAHSTINRKIREARTIAKNKPTLNDRNELTELQQFLV